MKEDHKGNKDNKKDIAITKPDKGYGVVILDWKLCNNGIKEIIWDTSKFEKLIKDHGTPKMRKFSSSDSFPKLRPIVSSIGTFIYKVLLKVPIDETIGWSLGNESLEENLFILAVPWSSLSFSNLEVSEITSSIA